MKPQNERASVRWNDGTYDASRICDECGRHDCSYPVHKDSYKEIVTKKSYWNWLEENGKRIAKTGQQEFIESSKANPDTLEDKYVSD